MSRLQKLKGILSSIDEHPLAGRHRVKAYSRFFKWQLSQFFLPGVRKVQFVGRTVLLVKKGMAGATGNVYCGIHEFEDMGFLLHFLTADDCFVDIGANIGSYSILASGVCGAYSVSFEPAPSTFNALKDNVIANGLQDLTELHNAAVGSRDGVIKFTSAFDTVNHVLAEGENEQFTEVPVVIADQILRNWNNIRLIKIDTEGFETEVLNGLPDLLQNPELKAIIIELNGAGGRYGYNEDDIHNKLVSYGFAPYSYDPFRRKLKSPPLAGSLNIIYIKDLEFVKHRIQAAKKIKVFSENF